MPKFFLSPSTDTDLELSAEDLKAALVVQWPSTSIQDIPEGNRLFVWARATAFGALEGYLNRKRQVVVLDGDVRDCAEFAQWYRRIIPLRYELVFYDDSYTASVPVVVNTTVHDLAFPWR